jgi:hypothetical protein
MVAAKGNGDEISLQAISQFSNLAGESERLRTTESGHSQRIVCVGQAALLRSEVLDEQRCGTVYLIAKS